MVQNSNFISIISYHEEYAPDFRQLNLEWLEKFNLTESHDMDILNNPRKTILEPGGCLFLAKAGNTIVGSVALIKEQQGVYELAKMAVSPLHQRKGIGKLLMRRCLDEAKILRAKRITLFSNHQLHSALRLYAQFGFINIPVEHSPYLTSDVKMELIL